MMQNGLPLQLKNGYLDDKTVWENANSKPRNLRLGNVLLRWRGVLAGWALPTILDR